MITSISSHRENRRRPLALFAGAIALVALSLGTSSCTHRHQVGASTGYSSDMTVEYDLPYDYLSGKYRQLYRTDPDWFHRHRGGSYYSPYAGK